MGRRVVSWSAEASRLRLMPIDSRLYRDVVDSYGGRYPGQGRGRTTDRVRR